MQVSKKIKIIEVISDSTIGGGSRHVLGLLQNINKDRFDVLLVAPRGWLTTRATKIKDVKVKIVEFKSKFDFRSLIKLKKNIAEFRSGDNPFGPIVIHAHGPRAGYFCRLAMRSGEKFVYTEHLWNSDFQLKNRLNGFVQVGGLKSVCRKADLVIAVSNSVKKFLIAKIVENSDKVKVIPNAIEISDDEPRIIRRPGRDNSGELIVGTIGALNRTKGQIYLIRAFSRVVKSLPKAKLEVIGDGPDREKLKKEIDRFDLESKIQLLGSQKEVKKIIRDWDLFVLPSLSETFGLVILEAFETGIPVLATSVGGVPEIVKNGETGVLVPSADPERMAKAICALLAEKGERAKLARAAYQILKERFDWSKIIIELEKEYQKLAQ